MIENELTSAFYQSPIVIPYATSISLDLSVGNFYTTTMTGNLTLENPTINGNAIYYYYITMDGTGGYTFSLGSNWNVISGIFDNTAGSVNILSFSSFLGQQELQVFINQRA